MSLPMTTHGNMQGSNEIKPHILHNRAPPEIKLSATGCTMASSIMSQPMMPPPPHSNEQRAELLGHRFGYGGYGYGYHHLYPYFGYGYGFGYPYRRCCGGYGGYPWYYF